jgi:hypothetical protein
MHLTLVTQTELLGGLRTQMRDTGATKRWSDAEIYGAINEALTHWHNRVTTLHVYQTTISGGHDIVPLPAYVGKVKYLQNLNTGGERWAELTMWDIHPDATGLRSIHIYGAYAGTLHVVHERANGPVPSSIATTSGSMTATSDTVAVTTNADVEPCGWIKVDGEWMAYSGVNRAASSVTLLNLARGQYETTAATHNNGVTVHWGVAAPDRVLYVQLYDQVRALLHAMYLTDAADTEKAHHERYMNYFQGRADQFWLRHAARGPRLRIV